MAELREEQIYEAFGIEFDGGEQEQQPAEAAQEPVEGAEEGGNVQEVAEPAEGAEPSDGDEAGEEAPAKETMDEKTRRENAARRRQQEQAAAINQAVEAALRDERQRNATALENIFTRAGLKNTFTGEPIRTQADFDAWESKFAAQRRAEEMKAGKMTPESLDRAIGEHPTVKQAAQVVAAAEQQRKQQAMQAAQQRIDAEIAEIQKINPSIRSASDVLGGPKGKEVYDLAKSGVPLSKAYRVTYLEDLERAATERARQQAAKNARGKEHLKPTTGSAGAGAVSVPKADMEMFRAFMPNASEAEIQAYYNNHIKR